MRWQPAIKQLKPARRAVNATEISSTYCSDVSDGAARRKKLFYERSAALQVSRGRRQLCRKLLLTCLCSGFRDGKLALHCSEAVNTSRLREVFAHFLRKRIEGKLRLSTTLLLARAEVFLCRFAPLQLDDWFITVYFIKCLIAAYKAPQERLKRYIWTFNVPRPSKAYQIKVWLSQWILTIYFIPAQEHFNSSFDIDGVSDGLVETFGS